MKHGKRKEPLNCCSPNKIHVLLAFNPRHLRALSTCSPFVNLHIPPTQQVAAHW